MSPPDVVLALDVGEKRIGVARANLLARLASPLTTLARAASSLDDIDQLIQSEDAKALVVGLPRGLSGQTTAQTRATLAFVNSLKARLTIPIHTQDEALTSHQATTELQTRGKSFAKADVDALAATYILDDWLQLQGAKRG